MMYRYALEQLHGVRIGNSKILIDGDELYLLTIIRSVEARPHRNKIYIDTNEDNVSYLIVNYDKGVAMLSKLEYNISRIRVRYRCIRRSIQRKVENPYIRNKLLAKYGSRERHRIEDRLKKVAKILGDIAEVNNATLVREDLDLKNSKKRKTRGRRLNYRLETFPYRKFFTYLDLEFAERGLSVEDEDARGTSITCPVCNHLDRRNRVGSSLFKCRKCDFTYNVHYVACLNLFSRHNDGVVAISGGRIILITREAGQVVPVNEAPNDPTTNEWVPEGEVRAQRNQGNQNIGHGQPLAFPRNT